MTAIAPERFIIQQEECAAQAATSESVFSRMGATNNFINLRHANVREFNINGPYWIIAPPNNQIDGIIRFPYNWELIDVYIYSGQTTSGSGVTNLDLKWKPFSSGSYASIFSSTPTFNSTAAPYETCGIGQSKTGFTSPILAKTQFNAYDQIRFDLLSAVSEGDGCGLGIVFRPR